MKPKEEQTINPAGWVEPKVPTASQTKWEPKIVNSPKEVAPDDKTGELTMAIKEAIHVFDRPQHNEGFAEFSCLRRLKEAIEGKEEPKQESLKAALEEMIHVYDREKTNQEFAQFSALRRAKEALQQ